MPCEHWSWLLRILWLGFCLRPDRLKHGGGSSGVGRSGGNSGGIGGSLLGIRFGLYSAGVGKLSTSGSRHGAWSWTVSPELAAASNSADWRLCQGLLPLWNPIFVCIWYLRAVATARKIVCFLLKVAPFQKNRRTVYEIMVTRAQS